MKNLKNEKGAITLFILASLLFFILAVTSVAINLNRKQIGVEENYQKIKSSYEKDANEVYKNTIVETTDESNNTTV